MVNINNFIYTTLFFIAFVNSNSDLELKSNPNLKECTTDDLFNDCSEYKNEIVCGYSYTSFNSDIRKIKEFDNICLACQSFDQEYILQGNCPEIEIEESESKTNNDKTIDNNTLFNEHDFGLYSCTFEDRYKECNNKDQDNTKLLCGIGIEGDKISNYNSLCVACKENEVSYVADKDCHTYFDTPYICSEGDRLESCDFFSDSFDVCGYSNNNEKCYSDNNYNNENNYDNQYFVDNSKKDFLNIKESLNLIDSDSYEDGHCKSNYLNKCFACVNSHIKYVFPGKCTKQIYECTEDDRKITDCDLNGKLNEEGQMIYPDKDIVCAHTGYDNINSLNIDHEYTELNRCLACKNPNIMFITKGQCNPDIDSKKHIEVPFSKKISTTVEKDKNISILNNDNNNSNISNYNDTNNTIYNNSSKNEYDTYICTEEDRKKTCEELDLDKEEVCALTKIKQQNLNDEKHSQIDDQNKFVKYDNTCLACINKDIDSVLLTSCDKIESNITRNLFKREANICYEKDRLNDCIKQDTKALACGFNDNNDRKKGLVEFSSICEACKDQTIKYAVEMSCKNAKSELFKFPCNNLENNSLKDCSKSNGPRVCGYTLDDGQMYDNYCYACLNKKVEFFTYERCSFYKDGKFIYYDEDAEMKIEESKQISKKKQSFEYLKFNYLIIFTTIIIAFN